MSDHIDRIRAFLYWRSLNPDKSHASPEAEDAIALLADYDALAARLAEAERLYMELIYAVSTKFPGETRHQTALRYIQRAETVEVAAATDVKKGGPVDFENMHKKCGGESRE